MPHPAASQDERNQSIRFTRSELLLIPRKHLSPPRPASQDVKERWGVESQKPPFSNDHSELQGARASYRQNQKEALELLTNNPIFFE